VDRAQANDSVYLLGAHPTPLMTATEETTRARRVRALRRELWTAILARKRGPETTLEAFRAESHELPKTLAHRLQRLIRNGVSTRTLASLADDLAALDVGGEHVAAVVGELGGVKLQRVLADYRLEKHRFVLANIGLVFKIAGRFRNRGLPLHDLVQDGCLGLMRAVDMFDPDKGFRFSTYAVWWIRHAIGRALADRSRTIRVPVHLLTLRSRLRRETPRLRDELGREPTRAELAVACQVTEERVRLADKAFSASMISLDQPRHEESEPIELVVDDPSEALDLQIAASDVGHLLESLDGMEADVVRKRFGIERPSPMTLQEIGDEYALSRERIRQIELKALRKMRDALGVESA
jgi:RNA polymerase sigma factor (sigma-70 family)